ncbi:MAG: GIY-YIG nuclease family protein [candidate division Zixibacteria bacterium]|nr:GIY-YIG nuclease family protein [candidate division Zixibacteria bacterium]
MKQSYVYIMASGRIGTLYIGVTSDLIKRVYEHKNNMADGFTKKHNVHDLVYYEIYESMEQAIVREKQMKKWRRKWKIDLIEKNNNDWHDLYEELI